MTEYWLHGEREDDALSSLPREDADVIVKQAVRFAASDRADVQMVTLNVSRDDLLEVEFDDGFTLWTTIDQLQADTQNTAQRTAQPTDEPATFPLTYPTATPSGERGFASTAIKAVKVLAIDLPEEAALRAAAKVERHLLGDGCFFRIDETGGMTREDPAGQEPILVLIHGTASSTTNAFAGLFTDNQPIWSDIVQRYQGRVFGFENRTLTKSPLENAIEFLKAIPTGANLHLVSHSRGGLIGDLIAHGRVDGDVFAADDLDRELRRAYASDATLLKQQRALFDEFNIQIATALPNVSRYVRVGCPAAGTTLASKRLDVYMSILINLVGRIPGVGPILGGLGELAAAVAKERTDPKVLPGLEAQMPTAPFVRLLNSSPHVLDSDLTVLAGDSDGLLKNLANLFYWRANDLVVDTRSMFGGAQRAQRLWHLEENRHVTHVNYFRRRETAQVVQQGLLRADGDTSGFHSGRPKGVERSAPGASGPGDHTDQVAVILVPGNMGSHLDVHDGDTPRERIWLDKNGLMRGRGHQLEMGKFNLQPSTILEGPYAAFQAHLMQHGVHVLPLAYDWRRSLDEATPRLDALIRERLAASDQPLHIVGHSMGGLVASLFMRRHPDTWQQLRDSGGRLIQVGTPNRGSYAVPRILQGRDNLIRLLAMLDPDTSLETWAKWSSHFPGLLEMSPGFDALDFSRVQTWKSLGVLAAPSKAALGRAKKVRDTLAAQTTRLAGEEVLYVAGGPYPTPMYDASAATIRFTACGDGRVTWDSGIPIDAATWFVQAPHGSLLDCKDAFDGLRELIVSGGSNKLDTQRPQASSTLSDAPSERPQLAREREVEYIPTTRDLERAAMMMSDSRHPRASSAPSLPTCQLSVVHGDLRFSRKPIVVGHYRGDQIVHAEDALDRCLGGALRSRYQLSIYPAKIGSAEVVLKQASGLGAAAPGPTGAIVLGLGNVGELTPGGLTRSIQSGLLRYAQACIEKELNTSGMEVAALLVGSGESGVSVGRSIESFLIAAANVNRALSDLRSGPSTDQCAAKFFSKIEFVELFKDVALEALHALYTHRNRSGFIVNSELKTRAGGRQRSRSFSLAPWWSRLQISCVHDAAKGATETLEFTAYGERARAAETQVCVQTSLIDRLIQKTIKDRGHNDTRLRETLFELLMPKALKGGAGDRRDLQLILDSCSAAYPWELLADRRSGDGASLSIGAGMLRQLRVGDIEPVTHPEQNNILVVGDPPSALPPLPGAQKEAAMVADLFDHRGGWQVVRQIRSNLAQTEITDASIASYLTTEDYRILHLAGHGVYDAASPDGSGMVIGDSNGAPNGSPFVLINSELVGNATLQPELVFINCCHLGRIERDVPLPKLAANLGEQFIRSGVKAVIAAGWPVDDEAANRFCATFYEQMLGGADFGTAVSKARQRIQAINSNTWAAYQCYGDPGYRLLMDVDVRSIARGRRYGEGHFLDVSELIVELDNLANSTTMAKSDEDRAGIESQLDELRQFALRKSWINRRGVTARIARIYAELKYYEKAIREYKKALKTEDGGVTLRDLERLANIRVRLGMQEADLGRVTRAKKDIEALIGQYDGTPERHSLLGSACKRLAQLQSKPGEIRRSVTEAAHEYQKAAQMNTRNWYYPATNALLSIALLGGPWKKAPAAQSHARVTYDLLSWAKHDTFHENLNRVVTELSGQEHRSFWDAAASANLNVLLALVDNTLHARKEELFNRYVAVIELFGSSRQMASVAEQWVFAEFVARAANNKERADAFHYLHDGLTNLA